MTQRTENSLVLSSLNKEESDMKIENIQKSYPKKTILRDITFSAQECQCIGILGSNGSGKSTLLGILAGILKADNGNFSYQGYDLMKQHKERSRLVGYVPQSAPLLDELSGRDNLMLWYSRETMEKELSQGVLGMLGIGDFLDTPVHKMSGGMRKRLAIGCAVAHNPKILLLDEPSAALDLVCKTRISNYLEQYKRNGGIIILATHDLQELPLCNQLYILKNGVLTPFEYDGNVNRLVGKL